MPLQGGLETPTLELVALESSRRLDVQSDWTSCPVGLGSRESDGAGGSIAAPARRRTTHIVKLGSFKNVASGKHPRANFKSSEVSLSPDTRVY